MPTFGSLFAGIGGLDIGLERAGWTCRWQVEIDGFCQLVLAKHWPAVARYGDIRALCSGSDHADLEPVDLICGGFPCQPVSVAGKRRAQEDERWLWPEFARVVRALRPRFVLVENVPGLLHADHGRAFGDVLGDLAASGYDAEWDCIPASAVGAPHRRDRVWIVGYRRESRPSVGHAQVFTERPGLCAAEPRGERRGRSGDAGWWAAEPDVRGVADELPQGLDGGLACGGPWVSEWPGVPRVAHGVKNRVDRLRSLGNAVVPQIAEWIGLRLMALHVSGASPDIV